MERFDPALSSEATEALRNYGEWLQSRVSPDDALLAATRALAAARPAPRRRWLVVVAVTGLLVISNVGLAAASDSAVPGDPLYGLKRAYEQLGNVLGVDSHADARLREAEVLLARGENGAALKVTQEALAELDIQTDLGDVLDDVEGTANVNSELATATEELVSLAKQIHESAHDSDSRRAAIESMREQAQRVAAMARAMNQGPSANPGQGNGPPDNPGNDHGGGPPDDSPSNTTPRNPNSLGNRP